MTWLLPTELRIWTNAQTRKVENNMPKEHSDPGMAALGELICRLNPYTDLPKDPTTGRKTGDMQLELFSPAKPGYSSNDPDPTIACMGIEVEQNYNTQWAFKGQQQNVKLAFRIPYRFLVTKVDDADKEKILYWQTEYLLVGYAGADGGG
jgi:hypothetical protein